MKLDLGTGRPGLVLYAMGEVRRPGRHCSPRTGRSGRRREGGAGVPERAV